MQYDRTGAVPTAAPMTELPATMYGVLQDRYGSAPERVLRTGELARPTPSDGQVLVRVHAASVDRGTWHVMAGLPYPIRLAGFGLRRPRYANPGRALAGTVVAVGAGVHGVSPGEAMYGIGQATFAEYAVAPVGKLAAKPAKLTFAQAAAVPISGLTALQAVRDHGRIRPAERVLIIGASGGVGSFAVPLAKCAGAEVTGMCSTGKVDEVRALGADHVIDYTREETTDGRRRYDVVLDIGGNRPLSALRRALTPRGRLVIVGGESGGRWLGGLDRQIRARLLSLVVRQQLGTFINRENAGDLVTLREMIDAGTLTPAVDRTYPLDQSAAAIRYLLDGRARGKIAIAVRDAEAS
jgi:NADPH:quinone reductase-like Zn-dependent oxidoreductase